MIKFRNNGRLIDEAHELPVIPKHIGKLYLDFETASGDPKYNSLDVWDKEHCKIIGAAVTWDNNPEAYFVPERLLGWWLPDLLHASNVWVNSNIKYDYHVLKRCLYDMYFSGKLICTVAKAHVFDADRTYNGGYGLKALSKTMLNKDIGHYEMALQPYLGKKNKDFGAIPPDILAEYACQDALSVRELNSYLDANMPEECYWVVQNEIKLTRTLIDIEETGLRIDPTQVQIQALRALNRMQEIIEELERLNYKVNPNSNPELHDLLVHRFGYPVQYNEATGAVSFSKHILRDYINLNLPYTPIVQKILEYRKNSIRYGLFWEPYLAKHQNGRIHCDYNQNVRSGRTSCRNPNFQQLDAVAKSQIIAEPGHVLLCFDASQIEYRVLAHYIGNEKTLEAYRNNADTDFHQHVADLCGVSRQAAKTLNFAIGFGAGKNKVTKLLSFSPEIIASTGGNPDLVKQAALALYYEFHNNLPELKDHQRWAEQRALNNGFVKTIYGRRLHLNEKFAYKGFNRIVQSTAADESKEVANLVSPVYNQKLRSLGVKLLALVHDEALFSVPDIPACINEATEEIQRCCNLPAQRFKLPLLTNRGVPAKNWKDAK